MKNKQMKNKQMKNKQMKNKQDLISSKESKQDIFCVEKTIPTVAIGKQNFYDIRKKNIFYIDKTFFIKEWWDNEDDITLITRPRRFGKTLTLDMVKTFFSPDFACHSDIFNGLSIWNEQKYRNLQGTVPVVFLSFSNIKGKNFESSLFLIKSALSRLFNSFRFIINGNVLYDNEIEDYNLISRNMKDEVAQESLLYLSHYLERYYGKKPIILLDEYDTPMHEAWIKGYWDELAEFMRGFFNATFKLNTHVERGLMTGITRIGKESLFSDLNNINVITTTSSLYENCFGFTEDEVFNAMDEYGLTDKNKVKEWYDGFIFGNKTDIYNPWSIIGYLKTKIIDNYWVDTSSNALIGQLIRESDKQTKIQTEDLLRGKSLTTILDEQVVFNQLNTVQGAIWSLMIASGYLKVLSFNKQKRLYEISLTNKEVTVMLESLVSQWFNSKDTIGLATKFRSALVNDDIQLMNTIINKISIETFSFFDVKGNEPERFYHGFALGLLVDMKERYMLESNRESVEGRYDVLLVPRKPGDPGIIIEFKALAPEQGEKTLEEALASALQQIKDKRYAAELEAWGVSPQRIRAYGFIFHGKQVLIGGEAPACPS